MDKLTSFHSLLQFAVSLEKQHLDEVDRELSSLPEGRLSMNHRRAKTYFIEIIDGKRRSIYHDKVRIYQLARKRYLELRRKQMAQDLDLIRFRKSNSTIDYQAKSLRLLEEFQKAGLDVARITMTEKQYAWMHASFRSNPYHPEDLQFTTTSGIRVRSKSERTIANRLELHGIPYRYEQELSLEVSSLQGLRGTRQGMYKTYYPDFTILRPSGEQIIWEHFGLLHLADYRETAFEKAFVFRQLGVVADRNMIISYECDLQDVQTIDDIIRRRILLDI